MYSKSKSIQARADVSEFQEPQQKNFELNQSRQTTQRNNAHPTKNQSTAEVDKENHKLLEKYGTINGISFEDLLKSYNQEFSREGIRQSVNENRERKSRSVEVQVISNNIQNQENILDILESEEKKLQTQKTQPIFQVKHTYPKNNNKVINNGRWTKQEHKQFLEALTIHGKKWNKVFEYVSTRNEQQVRSHAQKFFSKLKSARDSINPNLQKVLASYNNRSKEFNKYGMNQAFRIFRSHARKQIEKDKSHQEKAFQFKRNQVLEMQRRHSEQQVLISSPLMMSKQSPSKFTFKIQKEDDSKDCNGSSSDFQGSQLTIINSVMSQQQNVGKQAQADHFNQQLSSQEMISSNQLLLNQIFIVTKEQKLNAYKEINRNNYDKNYNRESQAYSDSTPDIDSNIDQSQPMIITEEELQEFLQWQKMQRAQIHQENPQITNPQNQHHKRQDSKLGNQGQRDVNMSRDSLDSIFQRNFEQQQRNRLATKPEQVNRLVDNMQRFSIEDKDQACDDGQIYEQQYNQKSSQNEIPRFSNDSRMDINSIIDEQQDLFPDRNSKMSGVSQFLIASPKAVSGQLNKSHNIDDCNQQYLRRISKEEINSLLRVTNIDFLDQNFQQHNSGSSMNIKNGSWLSGGAGVLQANPDFKIQISNEISGSNSNNFFSNEVSGIFEQQLVEDLKRFRDLSSKQKRTNYSGGINQTQYNQNQHFSDDSFKSNRMGTNISMELIKDVPYHENHFS
ncbi:myb-like dna-binding shaqkyf class family protein [Stylonychia lemnae]|uniref:Myb-like dna-binding shaqkyf class family protein n=1 Tax=Stylonychia lemnae TaxID=5949 RepID=A0A078AA30_STYLE|nr:myb-like dna-binding shaqkyf class family protein [Stylonychia lemnae]|eukprot:CDW78746.1 myb-like dna-binding shaqkyf class family protein [Stylonychia lemnae]